MNAAVANDTTTDLAFRVKANAAAKRYAKRCANPVDVAEIRGTKDWQTAPGHAATIVPEVAEMNANTLQTI
jgi:hypothetical protein